jgi:hypothetical protein
VCDGLEFDFWWFNGHLRHKKYVSIIIRPKMSIQVLLTPPNLFDHENGLHLLVMVDPATETAQLIPGPFSHPPENFQGFTPFLERYQHPYGRENHVLLHFVTVLTDRPVLLMGTKFFGALVEKN